MTLGERIKQARKARGLSLEKLAKKMGKSKQLVWQWELDESHPDHSDPRKHIGQLCKVLEVPYDHFFGNEPPSGSLEAKFWRLEPSHRAAIEAAMDALLAQQSTSEQPKRVK